MIQGFLEQRVFGGKNALRYAKLRYASPILVLNCKHGGKTFQSTLNFCILHHLCNDLAIINLVGPMV